MEGFRVFGDPVELDLSEVGGCTVTGPNSKGKSTIFDALLWCLYGDTAEHSADSIVTLGVETAEVEADFVDADGGVHSFKRRRKLGGSTSASYTGPEGTVGSVREVTAAAERLMGCDKEMWQMSCLARQGDLGRFSEQSPSRRRSLLAEMLIGDVFEEHMSEASSAAEQARRAVVDASDEEERLRSSAENAEPLIAELKRLAEAAEEADAEAERLRESRDAVERSAVEAAAAARRDLETAASVLKMKKAEAETCKTALERAKAELAVVASESTALAEAVQETERMHGQAAEQEAVAADIVSKAAADRDQAAAHAAALRPLASAAARRLQPLMRALEGGGVSECPTCGGALTSQQTLEIITEQKQVVFAESDARAAAEQKEAAFRSSEKQARAAAASLSSARSHMEKAKHGSARHDARFESVKAELAGRAERWGQSQREAVEASAALAPLKEKAEALQEAAAAARTDGASDAEVSAAERAARQSHQMVGAAKTKVESAVKARMLLPAASEAAAKAAVLAESCEALEASLKPAGMPHLLMGQRTSVIEKQVNSILARLRTADDGRVLSVRFRMSHPNSGSPALGIDVDCGGDGWLDYAQMSGGMRARVDLAFRVALMRAAGVQCRMLIIDEGTAMMDGPGVESAVDAVKALLSSGLLESVYLVTHDERLAGALAANIAVQSKENGSSEAVLTF